jgi:hypothetical protein
MLDAAHNIPGALLNPEHYDIADDVEHLRKLLETMDNRCFLQKDSADENPTWTIPELNAFYTHSIWNEESILKSDFCGFFHCISIFPVADIKKWWLRKMVLKLQFVLFVA